jgi:hypothetical protein
MHACVLKGECSYICMRICVCTVFLKEKKLLSYVVCRTRVAARVQSLLLLSSRSIILHACRSKSVRSLVRV